MSVATPDGPLPVVVGVDGSSAARRAVDWAARLARLEARRLEVIHARQVPLALSADVLAQAGVDVEALATGLDRHTAAVVDDAVAWALEVRPGLEVRGEVVSAEPREALVGRSGRAAGLVLGSYARGPVGSFVLGSVGTEVARRARCSVTVTRHHPSGAVAPRAVVVGIGRAEDARTPLHQAFRLATLLELPLRVVHCLGGPARRSEPRGRRSRVDAEGLRPVLAARLAPFAAAFPEVDASLELVPGSAARVLAEQGATSLVVVGRRSTRRPPWGPLGSTALALLERSHGPVVVVPTDRATPA